MLALAMVKAVRLRGLHGLELEVLLPVARPRWLQLLKVEAGRGIVGREAAVWEDALCPRMARWEQRKARRKARTAERQAWVPQRLPRVLN